MTAHISLLFDWLKITSYMWYTFIFRDETTDRLNFFLYLLTCLSSCILRFLQYEIEIFHFT